MPNMQLTEDKQHINNVIITKGENLKRLIMCIALRPQCYFVVSYRRDDKTPKMQLVKDKQHTNDVIITKGENPNA